MTNRPEPSETEPHVVSLRAIDADESSAPAPTPSTVEAPAWRRVAVIGIVVLALGALAARTFGGSDDTPDDAAVAEPAESESSPGVQAQSRADQLAAFQAIIGRADGALYYRSGESLARVDFADGSSSLLSWEAPTGVIIGEFLRLASDRGSWFVDPEVPDVAMRIAPRREIVGLADPTGTVAVIEDYGGATLVVGGFFDGRSIHILSEVDYGVDVELVEGRGAVISPLTGGSYLAVSGSPVRVSDGRIVAANADWFVELLCEDLRCRAQMRQWDTDETVAVETFALEGDHVRIAPDGRWILRGGDDGWIVYDVASATAQPIDAPGINASARWAPDSSYVVWVDDLELVVASVPLGEVASIDVSAEPLSELRASEIAILLPREGG